MNAVQMKRRAISPAAKALKAAIAAAAVALSCSAAPAQAHPAAFGINLPWFAYGHSFGNDGLHGWGPVYNGATAQGYLDDIKSKHMNMVRVFLFEDFQGLTFSGNNVTGVSATFVNNLKDFVGRANSDGINVYCTFLNFGDVINYSYVVTGNRSALINNAIVPVVRALQPYTVQYDLVNESNIAARYWNGSGWTNRVGWPALRTFGSDCLTAMRNAGNTHWVTMSIQDPNEIIYSFSSTVGGLGYNFYDCHSYKTATYQPLNLTPSNVGNAPLFVGEYGPASGWSNYSASSNQTTVDDYCQDADGKGYYGALAWCYLDDGSGYKMQGTSELWNAAYYGQQFGH